MKAEVLYLTYSFILYPYVLRTRFANILSTSPFPETPLRFPG